MMPFPTLSAFVHYPVEPALKLAKPGGPAAYTHFGDRDDG
jgi:hypothetical protein